MTEKEYIPDNPTLKADKNKKLVEDDRNVWISMKPTVCCRLSKTQKPELTVDLPDQRMYPKEILRLLRSFLIFLYYFEPKTFSLLI